MHLVAAMAAAAPAALCSSTSIVGGAGLGLSFSSSVSGDIISSTAIAQPCIVRRKLSIRAEGPGTKIARQLQVLQDGDKTAKFRKKVSTPPQQIKLLSKVQELRLLSKAESAGILSLLEGLGLSLSTIEKLGLLSKAEKFGILSAATEPKTRTALLTVAFALLAAGPAAVYFLPDDSTALVVVQVLLAGIAAVGGAAAVGGFLLVRKLQEA